MSTFTMVKVGSVGATIWGGKWVVLVVGWWAEECGMGVWVEGGEEGEGEGEAT